MLVSAVFASVIASPANAAPTPAPAPPVGAPPGSLVLSLEDAIARAEVRAPEIALGRRAVREAEASRVGAGVIMPINPRLSFDVRPTIRGGSPTDIGYAGTADFLFDVGGAPGARKREAERFVEVTQAELRVRRLEARARVWAAYVRVLVAEQRIRETGFALEIAERVLSASRTRAAAGAAGDIEQSLAESELAQMQATLNRAIRDREFELMTVRDALDLPAETPIVLASQLAEPGAVPDASALSRRALAARSDLEAIRRRIDLLVATQERLEREIFPRVGGYLGVDASPLSPMFGIVGVSVELPIAQRNQGPRARTRAQHETEMDRLEIEARRIVRDVYAARAAYEARLEELRTLAKSALPTAERTLDLVETGWRSGRFDIFRVTSAARDLQRVRGLRLDALEAAWIERILLDRVVGGLET